MIRLSKFMIAWVVLGSFWLVSCNDNTVSCSQFAKIYLDKETNIIVHDKDGQGRIFSIKGLDPLTGSKRRFDDMASLYIPISKNLEIGDTLEKVKGLNCFDIKKKYFDVVVSMACKDSGFVVKVDTVPNK